MIRKLSETVVAFACEWVPDVNAARMFFPEAEHAPDDLLRELLWARMGSTDANPRPTLPVMQSRLITMAMVVRKSAPTPSEAPSVSLVWLPRTMKDTEDERTILTKFIKATCKRPQLVGYDIKDSALRLLMQRALMWGIQSVEFLSTLKKTELSDYLEKHNDYSLDLKELITGNKGYKTDVTYDELCMLCGVPGKFDNHDAKILDYWIAGDYESIVRYNSYDAISNYLLWLRLAWISGCFSTRQYETEKALLHEHLISLCERSDTRFLQMDRYIHEWDTLQNIREKYYPGA